MHNNHHSKGRWQLASCLVAALAVTSVFGQQGAEPPPDKELQKLVLELTKEVRELRQRIDRLESGGARGDAPTEKRIEQLEQTVQEIKQERPTPDEIATIKQWTSSPLTMRPFWQDGLRFESNDKSVKMRIGGRIQSDFIFFAEDGDLERRFGDFDDGTKFRRARIYIEGDIRQDLEFRAQYDFADGEPRFKDVYMGFKKLPYVGNLRIGQFKEPFSLEELTSSNYITFMERSLANTLVPSRNVGLMVHNQYLSERVTAALGIFRPTDDFGAAEADHQYNITGRLTALPVYEDDGKKLLHVGIAHSYQQYEDPLRYRARPETSIGPRVVDTGDFRGDSGHLTGLELAWVHGPFSLQGEVMHLNIDGRGPFVGDPEFWGGYIEASYFLTGEHRPYNRKSASFDRVKPLRNFREDGGWGAWELASRYSCLDLDGGDIRGGRVRDFTLGLNWHLNPSLKIMWNYVYSNPSDAGDVSIFETRFQLAF